MKQLTLQFDDNYFLTDKKEKDYAEMYRDFCENVLKTIQSNELY